jgi:hypothetical protein
MRYGNVLCVMNQGAKKPVPRSVGCPLGGSEMPRRASLVAVGLARCGTLPRTREQPPGRGTGACSEGGREAPEVLRRSRKPGKRREL